MQQTDREQFVFIVGSPRSGTTVLGDILDCHDAIRQWYEPYFVFDHHFRGAPHDERSAAEARPAVRRQILGDFRRYRKKTGARIVVDKSPRNSLKIPFIQAVFPEARFIHILRDGRDATLSIHREWNRHRSIVADSDRNGRFNYTRAMGTVLEWLERQPLWPDRFRALWFETHGNIWNKSRHLNRLRWNGAVGWGARFSGWEDMYRTSSMLAFNAAQWTRCVDAIFNHWDFIPAHRKMTIRYETLLSENRRTLQEVLKFIDVPVNDAFFDQIPQLKQNNTNKWQSGFQPDELREIAPIITPTLKRAGYVADDDWADA